MKVALLFSALFLAKITVAQIKEASVILHQDRRLDSLYEALGPIVDKVPTPQSQRLVYRLMIDSIRNRQYAYRIKAKLADAYRQKEEVYISYWHPFFKIKLGDFLSKDSAASFKETFFRKFKLNTTVVPDIQVLYWKM